MGENKKLVFWRKSLFRRTICFTIAVNYLFNHLTALFINVTQIILESLFLPATYLQVELQIIALYHPLSDVGFIAKKTVFKTRPPILIN